MLVTLHAYVVVAAKKCMEKATEPILLLQTSEKIVLEWVNIYLSDTTQSESPEDITDMVFNYSVDFFVIGPVLVWLS